MQNSRHEIAKEPDSSGPTRASGEWMEAMQYKQLARLYNKVSVPQNFLSSSF